MGGDGDAGVAGAEPHVFGVRCRSGRVFGVAFTAFLVVFCYAVYVAKFAVPLVQRGKIFEGAACLVVITSLFVLTILSYARTCASHPGRVPVFFDHAAMTERCAQIFRAFCQQRHMDDAERSAIAQRLRVGQTVVALVPSMRFCDRCLIFKCSTTHHCSSCGTCVFELDHHCPWVGICIGRENHKFFLLFLAYTVLSGVFIIATAASTVLTDGIGDKLLFVVWLLCCVFSFILSPFVISSAQTVHQNTSTIAQLQLRRPQRFPPPRRPTYTSVDHDDRIAVTSETTPSSPSGLARIMGTARKVPWWFLPVAPQLYCEEGEWHRQLVGEVEQQVLDCIGSAAQASA